MKKHSNLNDFKHCLCTIKYSLAIFKGLLYLFILSSSYFVTSQTINKGEIIKDRQFLIDKKEISVTDTNGNLISIRPHRVNGTLRNYYIEFFNDLNFKERIEIETENFTDILDVFIINKKAYVFIKESSKKNTSLRFDIIELNTKIKTEKQLFETNKNDHPYVHKSLKNDYDISIDYSGDFIVSFPVEEKETSYTFVKIFNKELSTSAEHKIYPNKDLKSKNIRFLNTSQSNNKVYLLFNLSEEKEKYYQLMELANSQLQKIKIPIKADTYELINSKIKDSKYVISGMYSNQKKGGFQGFTYYSIDIKTFRILNKNQSAFLTEKTQKYFTGFFKSNRNIDIKDLFIDKDDNVYIVGQFYILRKKAVPIGLPIASFTVGGLAAYVTYNPISISYKLYDDILISKINSKGELIWDNLLELRQTEKIKSKSNKRDTSTFTFFDNNHVNIFMNGYINMEKNKLIVKQDKRINKTNFYKIIINPHGGITPKIVFPNEDSEILYRAENAVKAKNAIYILGQGNMRKQLLKLTL